MPGRERARLTLNPIPQRLNPILSEGRTKLTSGLKLPLFDLGAHPISPNPDVRRSR